MLVSRSMALKQGWPGLATGAFTSESDVAVKTSEHSDRKHAVVILSVFNRLLCFCLIYTYLLTSEDQHQSLYSCMRLLDCTGRRYFLHWH